MTPHPRLHSARTRLETVLERPDLAHLAPEDRAETLLLLIIELQRRIGLDLSASLDEASEAMFENLMEREADSQEIAAFFSVRIPDYRERVDSTIEAFCEECRTSLDAISAEPYDR